MPSVVLIAITGGSGSGKSWLARRLKRELAPNAAVLCLDDFYSDLGGMPFRERKRVNFDDPNAIDWRLFVNCLTLISKAGRTKLPVYDFTTHTRSSKVRLWKPKPVVLVEGLWLLQRPDLRRLWDLSLYVDCPEQVRLERRIRRDQLQRGRSRASVIRQFCRDVAPMHNAHVEPQSCLADMVLGPIISSDALAKLLKKVQKLVAKERA